MLNHGFQMLSSVPLRIQVLAIIKYYIMTFLSILRDPLFMTTVNFVPFIFKPRFSYTDCSNWVTIPLQISNIISKSDVCIFFFSKDHVKFLTQQLDECSVFSMIDFKGGNT